MYHCALIQSSDLGHSVTPCRPLSASEELKAFSNRDAKQRERERDIRDMCITQRSLIIKDALAGEKGSCNAMQFRVMHSLYSPLLDNYRITK